MYHAHPPCEYVLKTIQLPTPAHHSLPYPPAPSTPLPSSSTDIEQRCKRRKKKAALPHPSSKSQAAPHKSSNDQIQAKRRPDGQDAMQDRG